MFVSHFASTSLTERLLVTGSDLIGSIPTQLGSMSKLHEFDLSNNHLIGLIPTTLSKLKLLQNINLGNNYLTGSIPLLSSTYLSILDLRYNLLNGTISDSNIGTLVNLKEINLKDNRLSGIIPSNISKLSDLEYCE